MNRVSDVREEGPGIRLVGIRQKGKYRLEAWLCAMLSPGADSTCLVRRPGSTWLAEQPCHRIHHGWSVEYDVPTTKSRGPQKTPARVAKYCPVVPSRSCSSLFRIISWTKMSRCIVQSKQPTNRLRSLENIIPSAVLRVTAIDQTVSLGRMSTSGQKRGNWKLSTLFWLAGESRDRTTVGRN